MNILLLGGIAESRELAQRLIDAHYSIIYSLVGLVRIPNLNCEIHRGGFSDTDTDGTQGMAAFCRQRGVTLIIDATHPYAVQISGNAVAAAKLCGLPCWQLTRAGWDATQYPLWNDYDTFDDLLSQIAEYQRPFLSIGASALRYTAQRPAHQQWIVRSARPQTPVDGVTHINAIGPFSYTDEKALLIDYRIDALVSKNSGCRRIIHKLDAARDLNIPVYVQRRPPISKADAQFEHLDVLMQSITSLP